MSISEKILSLKKEKEVKTSIVCKEIGIPRSTWDSIVKDGVLPGTKVIIKICKYFNVSADWLLGLNEEKNN